MIKDFADWFQKITYGATGSRASFLRIHLWAIAALIAASFILPDRNANVDLTGYNQNIGTDTVRDVRANRNDPRGFHTDANSNETFDIAWIGGSTLKSFSDDSFTYIPATTSISMNSVNGRPVDTDIYFLEGLRIFDKYAALLEAIDAEPDLIVLALNPMWVLNENSVQAWSNLDGRTADHLLSRPNGWLLGAEIISPSDALWGLIGSEIDPLEQRWAFAPSVQRIIKKWDPLTRVPDDETTAEPSELDQIRSMASPLEFWAKYRFDEPGDISLYQQQQSWMLQANTSGDTLNDRVLSLMFKAIEDAGIPTYIYVTPIDPEALSTPEIEQSLAAIETRLGHYSAQLDSDRIHFNPNSLVREVEALPFIDFIHVGPALPLSDYFVETLCGFLLDVDEELTCERLDT